MDLSEPEQRRADMNSIGRKIKLSEMMILVAATAIGLCGSMMICDDPELGWLTKDWIFPTRIRHIFYPFFVYNLLYVLSPIGAVWSLALSVFALRKPRPAIHELANQPGVAACWAATLTMAITCGLTAWMYYRVGELNWDNLSRMHHVKFSNDVFLSDMVIRAMDNSYDPIGCSICSVWAIAAIGKRWSPEASWIDRTGLCLGVIWIMFMILRAVETPL